MGEGEGEDNEEGGGCGAKGGFGGYTDKEENRDYNNNASSREETEVEKRMRERMVG